ncbi:thioredoxin family protein [Ileibacterium valens]|uniref:thioredoxin family protein n=1 Tax=Ileibacterium valens TaxID=1862668 RepID=UPI002354F690|nr:thioredoxin family protein [Ileibacterium valens]
MIDLHTVEEFNQAIDSDKPTVVVWSANWCPDCVYLNPLLPAIEAANPDFQFVHMDRDENLDLAIEQELLGIPSLLTFQNGKETGRFVSKLRKTPEEIQEFLNKVKEKL